jgi:DNA-binding transcriptional regulator YiaG
MPSMKPNQIRALREALKMTQEEFAARLGLQTRGAVSKLESGAKEPKGPLLALLRLLAEQKRRQPA